MKQAFVVSCEHGGNRVPGRFRELFRGADDELASHRGWDPGALVLARRLARDLDVPLLACTTTRLVADANRSDDNPHVFSEWTRGLPTSEREAILDRYWRPHREAVEAAVRSSRSRRRPVVHLSVHSFTPVFHGKTRDVDVGFLYDPERSREKELSSAWREALRPLLPGLRLLFNRPYRGDSDGLTSYLRTRFEPDRYIGIELEISQRHVFGPPSARNHLYRAIVRSVRCQSIPHH